MAIQRKFRRARSGLWELVLVDEKTGKVIRVEPADNARLALLTAAGRVRASHDPEPSPDELRAWAYRLDEAGWPAAAEDFRTDARKRAELAARRTTQEVEQETTPDPPVPTESEPPSGGNGQEV